MKICKRVLSLLAALLLLALPQIHASAQTGSLSVQMAYGGQAVPGGSFTCYQLAALGADWRYEPVPAFTDCGIGLNGPLSPADARRLAAAAVVRRRAGRTLVMTTHDPGEAALCNAEIITLAGRARDQ